MIGVNEIIKFAEELMKLKDIKRTGWILKKVSDPESVADHTFSLTFLSYLFAKKMGLNENKAMKMALVHDINEILTGDIATRADEKNQTMDNATKERIENENTKKILELLPVDLKAELNEIWDEYNGLKSEEAKLVYNLDKLDYSIQVMFYKKNKRSTLGEDFGEEHLKTADQRINMPEIRKIFEQIKKTMREKN